MIRYLYLCLSLALLSCGSKNKHIVIQDKPIVSTSYLEKLEKIGVRNKYDDDFLLYKAEINLQKNDLERVLEILNELMKSDTSAEKKQLLVEAKMKMGDYQAAAEIIKGLDISDSPGMLVLSAEIHQAFEEYNLSLDNINKALFIQQDNSGLYIKKSLIYQQIEDSVAAEVELLNAFRLEPTINTAKYLITFYENNQRYGEILEVLNLINYQKDDEEKHIRKLQAIYFLKEGRSKEAGVILNDLIKEDTINSELFGILADLLLKEELYDSATVIANKAITLDPTNKAAHMVIARVNDKNWRFGKAREHYIHVLEQEPNYGPALEALEKLQRKIAYLQRQKAIRKDTIPKTNLKP